MTVERRSHLKVVDDHLTDHDLDRDSLEPPRRLWPDCGCSPVAYDGVSTTIVHSPWCETPEILLTPGEFAAWCTHPASGARRPMRAVPPVRGPLPEGDPEAYADYWSDRDY